MTNQPNNLHSSIEVNAFDEIIDPNILRAEIRRLGAEVLRLEQSVIYDKLTGVKSRFFFDNVIEPELNSFLTDQNRVGRRKSNGTILLGFADLNNLKRINDTVSHIAGDDAITAVAHGLESAVRIDDTVARWGGDEFVIVIRIEENDTQDLDQIKTAIKERSIVGARTEFKQKNVDVGYGYSDEISIAIAFVNLDDYDNLADAKIAVDAAMYDDKRHQHNHS